MRIPEFAEILIAQTGTWLRRGVHPDREIPQSQIASLRGGDPRTIASFLIRSLRWPFIVITLTSADVRHVGAEILKYSRIEGQVKVSGTAASGVTGQQHRLFLATHELSPSAQNWTVWKEQVLPHSGYDN
jgi:hypothetical protein